MAAVSLELRHQVRIEAEASGLTVRVWMLRALRRACGLPEHGEIERGMGRPRKSQRAAVEQEQLRRAAVETRPAICGPARRRDGALLICKLQPGPRRRVLAPAVQPYRPPPLPAVLDWRLALTREGEKQGVGKPESGRLRRPMPDGTLLYQDVDSEFFLDDAGRKTSASVVQGRILRWRFLRLQERSLHHSWKIELRQSGATNHLAYRCRRRP